MNQAPQQSTEQFAQPPHAESSRAPTTRGQEMLLDFLREHDASCPLCGYNLKALTRPICPECGQELVLTVGAARLRLGWLMAAVAPGFFSGIAAVFLLVPIASKRCAPVAASITQQTLLNLPRSNPRIVAYPMQSPSW